MSQIQDSARLLAETLEKRNASYTGGLGEFYNFEKAAEFANLRVMDVLGAQLAIKFTRLRGLLQQEHEYRDYAAIEDTLLDIAGYATISHAYVGPSVPR